MKFQLSLFSSVAPLTRVCHVWTVCRRTLAELLWRFCALPGLSWQDKVTALRAKMTERKVSWFVATALDEIACTVLTVVSVLITGDFFNCIWSRLELKLHFIWVVMMESATQPVNTCSIGFYDLTHRDLGKQGCPSRSLLEHFVH